MKKTLIHLTNIIALASIFLFVNLANAESITVHTANSYPYENLINRTHQVKVFYITNDENISCRVEVALDGMKWTSVEKNINKELFTPNILSNCLSKEAAEQILFQTFIQFGRGL